MTTHDTPLAPADIATLRLWADAQPAHASVSIFALQRALATVVDLRRQLQDAKAQEDAAWGLLVADLAPDGAP